MMDNADRLISHTDEVIEQLKEAMNKITLEGFGIGTMYCASFYTTLVYRSRFKRVIEDAPQEERDRLLQGVTIEEHLQLIEDFATKKRLLEVEKKKNIERK
jgi:hypothetical protein